MVFAGLYPIDSAQYEDLRDAMEKLRLNDASFFFEPESSTALGFGFRCGFLGLLHMEIIQERLEREFNLELITTAPGVRYRVTTTDGAVAEIDSPSKMPDTGRITKIEEPFIEATILTNDEFLGGILPLLDEKRGVQKKFEYVTTDRVMLVYELPLNEIVLDFYDRLKSVSKGYASLDYHLSGYQESKLVKLDVLVSGEPVDALSLILHTDTATAKGRLLDRKNEGAHPAPDVRGRDPGRHRQQGHRPRNRQSHGQERHRQMLRRRHLPQTQAARKTKRRQKADEKSRPRRDPAGSVSGRPEGQRKLIFPHRVRSRSGRVPMPSERASSCVSNV